MNYYLVLNSLIWAKLCDSPFFSWNTWDEKIGQLSRPVDAVLLKCSSNIYLSIPRNTQNNVSNTGGKKCHLDSWWAPARSKSVRADSLVCLLFTVAYLSLRGRKATATAEKGVVCRISHQSHFKGTDRPESGIIGKPKVRTYLAIGF